MLRRGLLPVLLGLAIAGPAAGGTITVKLGLVGGKLAVASAPTSLAAGATTSIPVKVADGRGSGAGWTLRFKDATGLTVTGITARCASNSTCTLPTAAGTPSGATVLKAVKDSGMGIIELVVTVRASSAADVAFGVS
ncbi:MAG TPA: hypothetical protein VFB25_01150 [Gaiellaceae bacterium]|nr:hypothetical protein [Gaiellaceae bacterium]